MSKTTTTKPARQCHLQWVPVDDLVVNPVAQRDFIPVWAQWLYDHFDLDKMQVPHINERPDGSRAIMEGQHTIWAYRQWVGEGQQIQAWLYHGLSEPEEAEYFLSLNDKKAIKPMPKFRAAITAERPVECDIDRIVRLAGCTIGGGNGGTHIQALGALRTIYDRDGGPALGVTLRVVRDSFADGGYERPVLLGVAMVLARYPEIDIPTLVKRLAGIRNGWKGLIQKTSQIRAAMGCGQSEACAAAVIEVYNAGRGKKLPSWWRDAA